MSVIKPIELAHNKPAGNSTELTVSYPAVAKTIASTHCTYPQRDGQAEWAWINTGMVDPP